MIGFKGARVIVVDDDEDDALPVLKAFAKTGVPCAFFDGSLEGLPLEHERLTGVRLAILDMDLVGGGVSDKSKATTLVSRLEGLLSPLNGPYAVLVWTKHPELIELFEEYTFASEKMPKPIIITTLTKDQCQNRSGDFNLEVVTAKIDEAISQFSPLQFLQAWEEKDFEAATQVTNILSDLVLDESEPKRWRDAWRNQLLNLMYALAKEAAGESLDENTVLGGLYGSLNPLHSDRMESCVSELSVLLSGSAREILKHQEDCGIERKAVINRMLHLAVEGDDKYAAGNIYRFEPDKAPGWVPTCDNLLTDFLDPQYNRPEQRKELCIKCHHVLVEISASCDHAQKNIRIARFVAGLIIPESERGKVKRAEYIWKLGPLMIGEEGSTGLYSLYFSARHLMTSSVDEAVGMKPFMRLRSQAFIHLQAWFARHASRPGLILLHEG